jgi:hypothetical protein
MQSRTWKKGIAASLGMAMALGGLASAIALGACSAGPGADPSESTSQALGACRVGCNPAPRPPPVKPLPVCADPRLWPYPEVIESSTRCLLAPYETYGGVWRPFADTPFENDLVDAGCSYSHVRAGSPDVRVSLEEDAGDAGLEKFNVTACPAGCPIDNLVASFVGAMNPDGTPVDPYIAESSPTSCDPTLPTGYVYVEWDPRCSGGCPLTIE